MVYCRKIYVILMPNTFFSHSTCLTLRLQWIRILTKICSVDDVRTFRQRLVVIVYEYSDEVIAIHNMDDCDDLLEVKTSLGSPLTDFLGSE